jgi:hypothetical protein
MIILLLLCLFFPVCSASDFDVTEQSVAASSNEVVAKESEDESHKFYEAYLSQYYPKALVIRERFFSGKDVAEVAGALKGFVNLLATEPWFYVTNTPKGFKLAHYWEFIIDQCSLINAYLKKACVNLETNKVFVPQLHAYGDNTFYMYPKKSKFKKEKKLIDYLKNFENEIVASFYALSFDFVVKLFNEGVLLGDMRKANRYQADLTFILSMLQGTMYEAEYQEYMKIVKELWDILKHKKQETKNDYLNDPLVNNNEQSRKYFQETALLEV